MDPTLGLQNALHWIAEYHIDGLRLDATHAIVDDSDIHILQELTRRAREVAGEWEDIALLRAVKRSGGRGVPCDGSRVASCRMYTSWAQVQDTVHNRFYATTLTIGDGRAVTLPSPA